MSYNEELDKEITKDLSINNRQIKLYDWAIEKNDTSDYDDVLFRSLPERWYQRITLNTFLKFINEFIKRMILSVQEVRARRLWSYDKKRFNKIN